MSILPFRFQSPTLSATKFTSPAPGRFGRLPKHQALVFNGSLGLHALHGSSFWGLVDVQVDFDTERGSLVFSKDPQGKISSFAEQMICVNVDPVKFWSSQFGLVCLRVWRDALWLETQAQPPVIGESNFMKRLGKSTVNGRSLALTIFRMVETCKHSGTFWTLHDQWEKEYIHKHSTWSKDSLWHCEILSVTLWAVLLLLRKVRHVQIRLLQGYGNAMCLGSEIFCGIVVSRVGWSSFFPSQVPISQLWKMWHSSTLCHGCHSFLLVEYFLWVVVPTTKGKHEKRLKNKHIQVQGQDVN